MFERREYRVHKRGERWRILRGVIAIATGDRVSAIESAQRLAESDRPSRVVIENDQGDAEAEWMFD